MKNKITNRSHLLIIFFVTQLSYFWGSELTHITPPRKLTEDICRAWVQGILNINNFAQWKQLYTRPEFIKNHHYLSKRQTVNLETG